MLCECPSHVVSAAHDAHLAKCLRVCREHTKKLLKELDHATPSSGQRGQSARANRSLHQLLEDTKAAIGKALTIRAQPPDPAGPIAGAVISVSGSTSSTVSEERDWQSRTGTDRAALLMESAPPQEDGSIKQSEQRSDVNNTIMREGLLSSHSFACIEVEFPLAQGKNSDVSGEYLRPWTVVRASQGSRALFALAPWGELTGNDFLQMIHRDDIFTVLSLNLQQQSGCEQTGVIARVLNFFRHSFIPSDSAVTDNTDSDMNIDFPADPFNLFEDSLFEDDEALSCAAPLSNDSRNVFIASGYQSMRVKLVNCSSAAQHVMRALLLLEPREHPGPVVRDSMNEVLEVFSIVSGIYVWDKGDLIGPIRARFGMDVSPATRELLTEVSRITNSINEWRLRGVAWLSNLVYRIAQLHFDFRVESNGVVALNVNARLCVFGFTTGWKFFGQLAADSSPVSFANGPEGTVQACSWTPESPDEAGKVAAFNRFVIFPGTSSKLLFSLTHIWSQKGTLTTRGVVDGKMFSHVFKKIGDLDLIVCRENDDRAPGMSVSLP